MSNVSDNRKRIGRPPVGSTFVGVRIPPDLLAQLDAWIDENGPDERSMSRPEAIRLLLSDALQSR